MRIARYAFAVLPVALACAPTSTDNGNQGTSVHTLILKVQGAAGRIQGAGIPDCQTSCTVQLPAGTRVTLTAAPDPSSGFTSWSDDCSGTGPCTIVLDANRTATATFSSLVPPPPGKHWLTVSVKGAGSISSSPAGIDCGSKCVATFDEGANVTLTAAPASGFHFSGFGGACTGTTCNIAMTGDASVQASFDADAPPPPPVTHSLTVARSGDGSGTITSSPAGIDCGGSCNASFADGMDVTLTAAAASGSTFQGWQGACSGTAATCSVHMGRDARATAAFQLVPQPDECAGFAPRALPPPVTVSLDSGDIMGCGPGNTDGAGDVAVTLPGGPESAPGETVIFDPAGKRMGTVQNHGSLSGPLLEQLDGFQGNEFLGPHTSVFTIRPDGTYTAVSGAGFGALDPLGGMIVFVSPYSGSMPPPNTYLDAYDAHGNRRWHVALDRSDGSTAAVDRTGNIFLLFDGSVGGKGQWVDHDGHVGSSSELPAFAKPSYRLSMWPRVGSGLFAQRHNSDGSVDWVAQIDSGAATMSPPPDWLSSRRDVKIHMAFGGRAYALIDLPKSSTSCTQQIEVVAPSGKSCGKVTLPIQDGTCNTSYLDVGYDGTVVQLVPPFTTGANGQKQCTWRWWPGVFR